MEDVTEGDDTVTIQTAGNDRAIAEDAEMIAKAIAKELLTLHRGIPVGPCEEVAPLQKEPGTDAEASGVFGPGGIQAAMEIIQSDVVSAVVKAPVPKAEGHEDPGFGGALRKISHLAQVAAVGGSIGALEAMERDTDLMGGGGDQGIPTPLQQGAIGGDHAAKAGIGSHAQELRKLRVGQGLTHQMVIQVFGLTGKTVQDPGKFVPAHGALLAAVAMAKGAAHIADICDLHIDARIHKLSPLFVL